MAAGKRKRAKTRYSAPTKELERKVANRIKNVQKKYNYDLQFGFKLTDDLSARAYSEYRRSLYKFLNSSSTKFKTIKNEHESIVVSFSEYNRFKKAVKVANAQRKKTKKKVEQMLKPPEFMKKSKVKTNSILEAMQGVLQEPKMEFLQPLSSNLSMVHTRKEFEDRLQSFEQKSNPKYIDERISQMKENYIHAILNQENGLVSGANDDAVSRIVSRIAKMSNDDFYAMYLSDEDLDFTYIYNEEDKMYMVNKIEAALDQADKGIFKNS